eukprot:16336-Heterococcus_DN1.PRE.4
MSAMLPIRQDASVTAVRRAESTTAIIACNMTCAVMCRRHSYGQVDLHCAQQALCRVSRSSATAPCCTHARHYLYTTLRSLARVIEHHAACGVSLLVSCRSAVSCN